MQAVDTSSNDAGYKGKRLSSKGKKPIAVLIGGLAVALALAVVLSTREAGNEMGKIGTPEARNGEVQSGVERVDLFSELTQRFDNQFSAFEGQLSRVVNEQSQSGESLTHTQMKMQGLITTMSSLRSSVHTLKGRLDEMGLDLKTLNQGQLSTDQMVKKLSSVQQEKQKNRFDLDIDGIGLWAGEPFVTIGFKGRYHMVVKGQKVNNWVLVNINTKTKMASFKHAETGKQVKRKA